LFPLVEWHRNGRDLEIEFLPGGPTTFYFYDSQTQVEREGLLQSNVISIQELADQLHPSRPNIPLAQ
jgi:hypothetical protein